MLGLPSNPLTIESSSPFTAGLAGEKGPENYWLYQRGGKRPCRAPFTSPAPATRTKLRLEFQEPQWIDPNHQKQEVLLSPQNYSPCKNPVSSWDGASKGANHTARSMAWEGVKSSFWQPRSLWQPAAPKIRRASCFTAPWACALLPTRLNVSVWPQWCKNQQRRPPPLLNQHQLLQGRAEPV